MDSVFNESHIGSALEKFGDFVNKSSSGFDVPGWADAGSKVIIDSLQAFERKARGHDTSIDWIDYHLGPPICAICELQAFVTHNRSDIPHRKAARIYLDFLAGRIEQLRKIEHEWDRRARV
jgi:hypothetical protein